MGEAVTLRLGFVGMDSPIWEQVSCGKYLGHTGTYWYCGAETCGRTLCSDCQKKACPECAMPMEEHPYRGFGEWSHPEQVTP